MQIQDFEIWRQIPPEEKVELMSQAHSKGVGTALMVIVVACTLAVGFKTSALMWCSFIFAPFVFQFSAGKAWKALRPRLMLEYLAARSAARRYAFAAKSKDLGLSLLFRGNIEKFYDDAHVAEALEEAFNNTRQATAWIALFNDAVVVMSEKAGGARLEFAHVVDAKLSVEVETDTSGDSDKPRSQAVYLTSTSKHANKFRVRLSSKYPAAIHVFAHKLEAVKRGAPKAIAQPVAEAAEDVPDWMKEFPELG